MAEIGASEARTHLPRLLRRVQEGERLIITRHGQPVAELIPVVPVRPHAPEKVRAAIAELNEFRKTHSLAGLSVREMIEEGRRY